MDTSKKLIKGIIFLKIIALMSFIIELILYIYLNYFAIFLAILGFILSFTIIYCEFTTEYKKFRNFGVISIFGELLLLIGLFILFIFRGYWIPYLILIILLLEIVYFGIKRSEILGILTVKQRKVSEEVKYELFGIIRAHNKLDFSQASKILKISEAELKRMIYQLIGKGEINGVMEKKSFILESGVDQFLEKLDAAFSDWESSDYKIYKKIVKRQEVVEDPSFLKEIPKVPEVELDKKIEKDLVIADFEKPEVSEKTTIPPIVPTKKIKIGVSCSYCSFNMYISKDKMDYFKCQKCASTSCEIAYYCPKCEQTYTVTKYEFIALRKPQTYKCPSCSTYGKVLTQEMDDEKMFDNKYNIPD